MSFIDKPFYFVIGAQKSGTTAIHRLFSNISVISLPKIKETHYFSDDSIFNKGIEWYYNNFNFNREIMIEVDPSYLFFPNSSDRINNAIKNPKFIIIFRRPLERAFSHYLMSCYRGYEEFSFKDALDNEGNRLENDQNKFSFIHHSYLERGNYISQLNRYTFNFDRSNFLFIKFDDLISEKNNKDILNSICNFINIDYSLLKLKLPKTNSKKKIKSLFLRDLLYKENYFKKAAKLVVPSDQIRIKIKKIIDFLNSSNYTNSESRIEIDNNLKSLPKEYILWNNNQAKLLADVSNLDLDDWIYT